MIFSARSLDNDYYKSAMFLFHLIILRHPSRPWTLATVICITGNTHFCLVLYPLLLSRSTFSGYGRLTPTSKERKLLSHCVQYHLTEPQESWINLAILDQLNMQDTMKTFGCIFKPWARGIFFDIVVDDGDEEVELPKNPITKLPPTELDNWSKYVVFFVDGQSLWN